MRCLSGRFEAYPRPSHFRIARKARLRGVPTLNSLQCVQCFDHSLVSLRQASYGGTCVPNVVAIWIARSWDAPDFAYKTEQFREIAGVNQDQNWVHENRAGHCRTAD